MRSSTDSVNGNEDLVSRFYASTCLSDHVYDIFENEEECITEDSIVWVDINKKIGKGGLLKFLIVTCHRIANISN